MWPVSGASKPVLSFACPAGRGCCVSAKHRVIVVSCVDDDKLYVYDLDSGQLLRTLGLRTGSGQVQLHLYAGGLCFGFSGDTVMVADYLNRRVTEVTLDDGAYVTHYNTPDFPEWVDCDSATETLLVTSKESATLLHVRTGKVQQIVKAVGMWAMMMPARFCGNCGNEQSVLVHSVDRDFTSHIRRLSLAGDKLETACIPSIPSLDIIDDVMCDVDDDATGPVGKLIVACDVILNSNTDVNLAGGALIVCTGNLVGPLEAVQAKQISICWHTDVKVDYPYTHLAPVRDGSGTIVVRKPNSVHVLRNPERDLRWAWVAATAVAFARFSNVQNESTL